MLVNCLKKLYICSIYFSIFLVVLINFTFSTKSYNHRNGFISKILPSSLTLTGYYIPSSSMAETLHTGDVTTSSYYKNPTKEIKRGDVIVFWHYNEELKKQVYYTKRVIGLPGEHIVFNDVDDITINGVKINEPYIYKDSDYYLNYYCIWENSIKYNDVVLSDDEFFVMGDNRYASNDSRYWGPVTSDLIATRQVLYFRNIKDFGAIPRPEYPELSDEN